MAKTSTSAPSQLSPKRYPADAFVWWQSLLLLIGLIGSLVVPPTIVLAFLIVFKLATLHDASVVSWPFVTAQLAAYAVGLALLLSLLPAVAHRSLAELGLRAPSWRDVAWGVGGAVAMLIAASAVAAVQETILHLKPDEVQVRLLREAHGTALAGFAFMACVGAPIVEELTFRGLVFNALRRYMPVSVAVALAAALFGLAHMQPGNAGAVLPLMMGGAVLVIVYYRSGSLVSSMITHSLFNAFTVVAVVSGRGG